MTLRQGASTALSAGSAQADPAQLLMNWLNENGLQLTVNVVVAAPMGDTVNPMNFIPQGWQIQPQIQVVYAKESPRDGVPDLPANAGVGVQ